MSKGYDKACDLWSFGVLTYELVVGNSPFFGPGNHMDMFKRIVKAEYEFPWFVTETAQDFIKHLLVRRPTDRLGNRAQGHAESKKHPWFSETMISFKKIMARTQASPWVPEIKDPLNLTSFDDYSHLENDNDDDGPPLTKEEQAMFAEF
jgi:serine/threonine protein kinase